MEDLSEKEQLEKFREWWKENGNFVIGGIVLGIAIMVGISQWKTRNIENQVTASVHFEAVMGEVDDGDLDAAEATAVQLYDEHSSSVYAAQARLAMARLYMDKGRDEDAADTLRGMLSGSGSDELQQIGRLRLAKVLLYQNKPQDVIDLLEGREDSEYLARFSELLGDAYVALERYEDAAEAYAVALSDDQRMPTVDMALLRWKLNDLPEATAEPSPGEPLAEAASANPQSTPAAQTDSENAIAENGEDEE